MTSLYSVRMSAFFWFDCVISSHMCQASLHANASMKAGIEQRLGSVTRFRCNDFERVAVVRQDLAGFDLPVEVVAAGRQNAQTIGGG
jgi:hypothetical protein